MGGGKRGNSTYTNVDQYGGKYASMTHILAKTRHIGQPWFTLNPKRPDGRKKSWHAGTRVKKCATLDASAVHLEGWRVGCHTNPDDGTVPHPYRSAGGSGISCPPLVLCDK
eukprot:2964515-Pyramimonas_sp.AAC.1